MKKRYRRHTKSHLGRNLFYSTLLVAACLMFVTSGVNVTRSALSYESGNYDATVEAKDIDVVFTDSQGTVYSYDKAGDNTLTTLKDIFGKGQTLELGKAYPASVYVTNPSRLSDDKQLNIPEYCRVIVHKYWAGKDGEKLTKNVNLDPSYIQLSYDSAWQMDTSWTEGNIASHPETEIYYYPYVLNPGESVPFLKGIFIDKASAYDIGSKVTVSGNEYYYTYDGIYLTIELEAQAVQTHNASAAIVSSWGTNPLNIGA